MGKRGPAPRPTQLKVLQGEKASRINDREAQAPAVTVTRPASVTAGARKVWDYYAPSLIQAGLLTVWDVDNFAAYCQAVARHREASKIVAREGVICEGSRGPIKHPAAAIAEESARTMRHLAQEFGLTPSARSGLRMPDGGRDELDRLLS